MYFYPEPYWFDFDEPSNIEGAEGKLDSHAEPYKTVMRFWLEIAVPRVKVGTAIFCRVY